MAELRVLLCPHPVRTDDTVEALVPAGQTITEILGREDLPAVVLADGDLVEPEDWGHVRPEQLLVVSRVPQGGDVGRILATIAVIVVAAWAGGAVGAWATAQGASAAVATVAASATTAAVTIAGSLLINRLIPPPDGGQPDPFERQASITGQSNRVAPFAPIPSPYGTVKYYPPIPMTALPYTELVGRDQYLRMLLVLGYGPLDIGGHKVGGGAPKITNATTLVGSPIRLGDTPIDQFDDVAWEIGDPDQVSLYTQAVVEQAVNVSMPISNPNPSGGDETTLNETVEVIRTTEVDTDEISLEVFFPALFTVSGNGNTRWAYVSFRVEYAPTGTSAWVTLDAEWRVGSTERRPVRVGRRYALPARGQYDIRLTRYRTFLGRTQQIVTDCSWTVLRSITRNEQPFDVDNTVVMALRIRATDQLGGRVDRLSVEATRYVQTWNGSAWTEAATRSPAWAYVDILTGGATRSPLALADVDTASLKGWADWMATEGLYFDQVFDRDITTFDAARQAAAAGLGAWSLTDDGKVSIIRDQVATPRALITPRMAGDFSSEKVFIEAPHALRVQFIDPTTNEQSERIVYDDGYTSANATRYEQLQTAGVRDADQAWKLGRYHLAQMRLRPEFYRWRQDIQHLVYARGDAVEIAQDVILVGLGWGRIKALTLDGSGDATGADVDEQLVMETGTSYALKIQRQDGSVVTAAIDTVTGGTTAVTFPTPVEGLAAGDHFIFGEAGSESLKAKVTAIEPAGDFVARIEAVPAADDIFDAWTGTIPAWNPVITTPVDLALIPPPAPEIVQVTSGTLTGQVDNLGNEVTRAVVEYRVAEGYTGLEVELRTRFRETVAGVELVSEWRLPARVPSDQSVIILSDVAPGNVLDIEVRSRRGTQVSAWSATTTHTVTAGTLQAALDPVELFVDFRREPLAAAVSGMTDWNYAIPNPSSALAIVEPVAAPPVGTGRVAEVDGYGVLQSKRRTPFEPGKLYRVRAWLYQVGAAIDGNVYVGAQAESADGRLISNQGAIVTFSGHYTSIVIPGSALPVDEWFTLTGYIRGHGATTGTTPAAGTSSSRGTPIQMHPDTRFLRGITLLNSATGDPTGTIRLGALEIDVVEDYLTSANAADRVGTDALTGDQVTDLDMDKADRGTMDGNLLAQDGSSIVTNSGGQVEVGNVSSGNVNDSLSVDSITINANGGWWQQANFTAGDTQVYGTIALPSGIGSSPDGTLSITTAPLAYTSAGDGTTSTIVAELLDGTTVIAGPQTLFTATAVNGPFGFPGSAKRITFSNVNVSARDGDTLTVRLRATTTSTLVQGQDSELGTYGPTNSVTKASTDDWTSTVTEVTAGSVANTES